MSRDFYAPIWKDKRARKKYEELQFFFFLGFLFGNILEESGPFQLQMKEKEILNSYI